MSSGRVILVTFGSNVEMLSVEIAKRIMISAFRGLKNLAIIWRFDNDYNLTIPTNVLVSRQSTQKVILC